MAAFNHLGLFPRFVTCPRQENLLFDSALADIWISSTPAFLYACAHYWRVKTWRASLDATWTEIAGGTSFSSSTSDLISQGINREYFTYTTPPEEDFIEGTTPSSESELICNYSSVGHSLLRFNQVRVEASGTGINFEYSYNVGDGATGAAIVRLDDSGNVSEVKTPFIFEGGTFRWSFRPYAFVGNTGTYGTFTYSLLGQSFTTPFYASNSTGGGSLSVSASLVAEEYWPYDPGDGGGPIYDSATGAQLRPFP